jgi:hypothetical protein
MRMKPKSQNQEIKQATQGLLDGVRNAAKGKAKIELPDGTKVETEHEGVGAPGEPVESSQSLDQIIDSLSEDLDEFEATFVNIEPISPE